MLHSRHFYNISHQNMKYRLRSPLLITLLFILPFQAFASSEWAWTTDPTPGAYNVLLNAEGETQEDYSNGDLSNTILLSEIMPNPEGTDTDTEWIEIYNSGTVNIDLGNWSLDDAEEGSTPYVFPTGTMVEAQDFLVISRADSDIALNNDVDEVRLFNYEGTLQDSVMYEDSPEGQSYARISLQETAYLSKNRILAWLIPTTKATEINWEWTTDITQGFHNPAYYRIEGEIVEVDAFENKIEVKQKDKILEISTASIALNGELKKSAFQKGKTIKGYAVEIEPGKYELKSIELENSDMQSSALKSPLMAKMLLILAMGSCGAGMIWIKKKDQALKSA